MRWEDVRWRIISRKSVKAITVVQSTEASSKKDIIMAEKGCGGGGGGAVLETFVATRKIIDVDRRTRSNSQTGGRDV